ncbi:Fe-S cluster assembly ATPase SufC [Candidatus Roizmanbacteria bacterium]|nr:Fe-S cluster assembly ATPase SufC [Candidatus Roizmanbacteria bacterium]
MLDIQHLTARVQSKTILKDFSYNFKDDSIYVIMGPNGSGKSTLANCIMGHPHYSLDSKSRIILDKKNVTDLSPDKRAKAGIFLSFQSPLSLQGVTVFQLLRVALAGKQGAYELKKEMLREAKKLKIRSDILERSLNDGSSGGERKKIEVLQAAVLHPKVAIFDEVDTGVDVDALKTISTFMKTFKKNKTIIFITHNSRILKYISPDKVLILKDGSLVKEGGKELLSVIEEKGFENL